MVVSDADIHIQIVADGHIRAGILITLKGLKDDAFLETVVHIVVADGPIASVHIDAAAIHPDIAESEIIPVVFAEELKASADPADFAVLVSHMICGIPVHAAVAKVQGITDAKVIRGV